MDRPQVGAVLHQPPLGLGDRPADLAVAPPAHPQPGGEEVGVPAVAVLPLLDDAPVVAVGLVLPAHVVGDPLVVPVLQELDAPGGVVLPDQAAAARLGGLDLGVALPELRGDDAPLVVQAQPVAPEGGVDRPGRDLQHLPDVVPVEDRVDGADVRRDPPEGRPRVLLGALRGRGVVVPLVAVLGGAGLAPLGLVVRPGLLALLPLGVVLVVVGVLVGDLVVVVAGEAQRVPLVPEVAGEGQLGDAPAVRDHRVGAAHQGVRTRLPGPGHAEDFLRPVLPVGGVPAQALHPLAPGGDGQVRGLVDQGGDDPLALVRDGGVTNLDGDEAQFRGHRHRALHRAEFPQPVDLLVLLLVGVPHLLPEVQEVLVVRWLPACFGHGVLSPPDASGCGDASSPRGPGWSRAKRWASLGRV